MMNALKEQAVDFNNTGVAYAAELKDEIEYLKASLKVARWELDAEQQRNNKLYGKTRAQKQELRRLNAVLRRTSLERQLREAKRSLE